MTPITVSPSKLTTLALVILLLLGCIPAPAAAAETVEEDWLPTNVIWYTPYESGNTLQYDGESDGYLWKAWIYRTGDGATTWTPPDGVNKVDVLIVAGGGSGGIGSNYAGGGGAGGMKIVSDHTLSSAQSIIIGKGGISTTSTVESGEDTTFGTLTVTGGGHGGFSPGSIQNADDGGSGGGSGFNHAAGYASPGIGISGEGNDGGGNLIVNTGAGGGGGKGSAGQGGSTTKGGDGGDGASGATIGINTGYAAGGAGTFASGTKGIGGSYNSIKLGGDAGDAGSINGKDAQPNTGSGGGGAYYLGKGGAGANGIIIIRYASATWVTSPENTPPLISFIASPRSGTLPINITFDDTSSRYPTNWSWSLRPTGGTSWTEFATTQHPVYQFSTVGYYDIKLTASNEHGSATRTQLSYIQVTEPANTTHPWHFNYDPTTGIYTRIWFDPSESLPDISLIWTATLLPIITLLGSLFFVWIWLLIVAGSWLYTQDTTSAYVIGILSGATMAGTASLIGADGAVLMVIVVGFAGAGVLSRVIVGKG